VGAAAPVSRARRGKSHPKQPKVFWFFFSKKNRFLLRIRCHRNTNPVAA
jgi:hypothetical protein